MKSNVLVTIVLLAVAAGGGWLAGRNTPAASSAPVVTGERKILFYQSPMHPWIKSDKPGNCTICGMKLAPVYEGDQASDSGAGVSVRLRPSSVNVLNVQVAKAEVKPLKRLIRVAGTIDDDDTRHRRLSAYVDGRVDKLGVRYIGAEVRAGDLLAQIYSPTLLAARDEYVLLTKQPASPQRDRLLSAAREKLTRLGLLPEQIEKLPSAKDDGTNTINILAPLTGTVVSRGVYEGQYVKEGDMLFEIADFAKMWFIFNAYEQDLSWIHLGQMVEVTSPLLPGKKFKAPIDFIDPNMDPATRSAKVRVILENPMADGKRELLHKVYADGAVELETPPVLTIPRSAVLSPGGEPIAYVVRGEGQYEPRKLRLGRIGQDVWEVLDGLKEGETVVTTGNLLVDAQAQLDHGGEPAHAPEAVVDAHTLHDHAIGAALTDIQRAAAKELITVSDQLTGALANDDLKDFNTASQQLHGVAAQVDKAFGASADWVTSTAHLAPAPDLKNARKDFYPFSKAVAELTHGLRQRDPSFANVHIFECPMVQDAVPNAPERKGRWVQLRDEKRNPFFGAEMIDCGVEVKP